MPTGSSLSACNTAAAGGDKLGTEALSGLAQSFFYAGARALLVSHWAVNSEATVILVTGAFDQLRKDASIGRAEALRRSMQALMGSGGRNAHPANWAPFVVVGEVLAESPFLCRFSDACMTTLSTRADGRRRRSAKARNRGRRMADGAAGYGELASRGTVTMVDFGWSNLAGPSGGRVGGGVWRAGKRVEPLVCGCIGGGEGRQGERDRRWPMSNVHDGWLCGEPCEQRS